MGLHLPWATLAPGWLLDSSRSAWLLPAPGAAPLAQVDRGWWRRAQGSRKGEGTWRNPVPESPPWVSVPGLGCGGGRERVQGRSCCEDQTLAN